jgi:DNA-binding NtrC family response regulator
MKKQESSSYSVLLAGNFEGHRERFVHALQGSGYETSHVTKEVILEYLEKSAKEYALVIIEDNGEDSVANSVASKLRNISPASQLMVINSHPNVLSSFAAQQNGVFWVVQSPVPVDELLYLVAKGCVMFELIRDVTDLRSAVRSLLSVSSVSLETPSMKLLIARAERIAGLDATVLLLGESGTGKTTLASFLHQSSQRHNGPFISISCASIPRELIEAELFGHEKGAYTGATGSRPGSFELADGGTIFLDEIGELPLDLQPKLLTFLQDRIVKRVGSNRTRKIDVRIICATNKDLKVMVANREFREDLYYRINVLNLEIPPLRERELDIIPLAEGVLANISKKRGTPKHKVSPEAAKMLKNYPWPGNIRELENMLERATAFAEGTSITVSDLDLDARHYLTHTSNSTEGHVLLVGRTLAAVEEQLILETLKHYHGDKEAAAKVLGISLKTIYNKIRTYQISSE